MEPLSFRNPAYSNSNIWMQSKMRGGKAIHEISDYSLKQMASVFDKYRDKNTGTPPAMGPTPQQSPVNSSLWRWVFGGASVALSTGIVFLTRAFSPLRGFLHRPPSFGRVLNRQRFGHLAVLFAAVLIGGLLDGQRTRRANEKQTGLMDQAMKSYEANMKAYANAANELDYEEFKALLLELHLDKKVMFGGKMPNGSHRFLDPLWLFESMGGKVANPTSATKTTIDGVRLEEIQFFLRRGRTKPSIPATTLKDGTLQVIPEFVDEASFYKEISP